MVACSARRSYYFTLQINKKYLEYQCDWLSFLGLHCILTLISNRINPIKLTKYGHNINKLLADSN